MFTRNISQEENAMTPKTRSKLFAVLFSGLFVVTSAGASYDDTLPLTPAHAYYTALDQDHLQERTPENEKTASEQDVRAIRKSL